MVPVVMLVMECDSGRRCGGREGFRVIKGDGKVRHQSDGESGLITYVCVCKYTYML